MNLCICLWYGSNPNWIAFTDQCFTFPVSFINTGHHFWDRSRTFKLIIILFPSYRLSTQWTTKGDFDMEFVWQCSPTPNEEYHLFCRNCIRPIEHQTGIIQKNKLFLRLIVALDFSRTLFVGFPSTFASFSTQLGWQSKRELSQNKVHKLKPICVAGFVCS